MLRSREEYLMDHYGIDREEADDVVREEEESRYHEEEGEEEIFTQSTHK